MPKQRATFAIVYDFDGTLAPGNLLIHGCANEDDWPALDVSDGVPATVGLVI